MKSYVLILNYPPFVGGEELLPVLGRMLDADWCGIDPLSQLLADADDLPEPLAWGLGDAITAARGALSKGRSIVLGWRADEERYRQFERAVSIGGTFIAAVTFAPPQGAALLRASRDPSPEAARNEVRQFYLRGCQRLSAGMVWEPPIRQSAMAATIISGWLRRRQCNLSQQREGKSRI